KGIPLHKMWDDALGTSKGFHEKQVRGLLNEATRLHSMLIRKGIETADASVWAKEGWGLAVEYVYLRGDLTYSKSAESAPLVPEGYTKNLKLVAESRVAVAGLR